MPISIFNVDLMRMLSFLVFLLCIYISLRNQYAAETKKRSRSTDDDDVSPTGAVYFSVRSDRREQIGDGDGDRESSPRSLEYDFYRDLCPSAERVVRETVRERFRVRPDVAPGLIRLAFHDCFIEGCDASVLLDSAEGIDSEKNAQPNLSLKGFEVIDHIKSVLEGVCPRVVSCADIVVLAARESVVLGGGPFYPLYTGRRDSTHAFRELANLELPSPHAGLPDTLASFTSRGFDERETVSLLGAHSIGVIHCNFVLNRLYNFAGTGGPDPSMDPEFRALLRSRCSNDSHMSSSSLLYGSSAAATTTRPRTTTKTAPPPQPPSNDSVPPSTGPSSPPPETTSARRPSQPEEPVLQMDYEREVSKFGALYYRSLLQGKGILYADQQLMVGEETGTWVRAYASDPSLFHRDFAMAMMKLSSLRVLTGHMGQVRRHCAKVE